MKTEENIIETNVQGTVVVALNELRYLIPEVGSLNPMYT